MAPPSSSDVCVCSTNGRIVPGDLHTYDTVNPLIRIVPFVLRNVMADLQYVSDVFDIADTVVYH